MAKIVMVVDDQPGIRLLFEEIIKQDGHQVVTAENGKEALDKIEQEIPDLLILDYSLPIMNGSILLESLKEKNIYVPAIMMSGLSEKLTQDNNGMGMVKKVLAKPFDISKVREEINSLLRTTDSGTIK